MFRPLYDKLGADVEVLGRALAGRVDSVPAMLFESGVSEAAMRSVGIFLFGMHKLRNREHWHFHLRMDCLRRLVSAGVDLRAIVVNPLDALWQAVSQYKCLEIRAFMKEILHELWYDAYDQEPLPSPVADSRQVPTLLESRPQKWRHGRTLLEMAIRCGQLEETELLVRADCEASLLTASDLEEPLFHGEWEGSLPGTFYEVTINKTGGSAEAARLAYHLCRHRHQIVLVQWTGWWSCRSEGVRVAWSWVIDHIASFALAVPPLPEILQLPRPMGTRNAARRAARRRAKAGCRVALDKQVPDFNHPPVESAEHVAEKVIEEADVSTERCNTHPNSHNYGIRKPHQDLIPQECKQR